MAHVRIEVRSRHVDRERPYKFAHHDRSVTSNEVIVVSVPVSRSLFASHSLVHESSQGYCAQPQHSVSRTH